MSAYEGTCLICGQSMDAEDALVHMQTEHRVTVRLQRWPDGSPVVIDQALTAEDFGTGPPTVEGSPR